MFNDKVLDALFGGDYICSKCGGIMEPEDEWYNFLVCPACGHSIDYDMYGYEDEGEYEALYPTKEEVLGYDDDDYDEEYDEDDEYTGEVYEEELNELDD